MPLYDIEHVCHLTESEQQGLATALTNLHASRFKTPKLFVNVRFTDASAQVVFRGGRRARYNRVVIRTRVGEQRTKDVYDEHCRDVVEAWEGVMGKGKGESEGESERGLRTVWVLGALTTAVECGIARPRVGEEESWIEKNMDEFKRLAGEGDEDFIELLAELESR